MLHAKNYETIMKIVMEVKQCNPKNNKEDRRWAINMQKKCKKHFKKSFKKI